MEFVEEVSDTEKAIFKKKVQKMAEFKGSGTELISVYIPPSTDRSSVMDQLNEEISQSSNIKDPKTRKNVQGALRRITNFLKQINFKIPQRGLVVFAGNVSPVAGKSDIKLFTIHPTQRLKVKLYWCDSEFHLAPLKEMLQPSEIYGLVTIDKNESTIALLKGKKYEIVGKFRSRVAGKIRAGGQCLIPETLIQLSNGDIIEIKGSHNPLEVCSVDFEKLELNNTNVTDKWENQKKELIKITTKFPKIELTCSPEHTVFKIDENDISEIEASQLKEGDILIMPERMAIKGSLQKLNTVYYNSYKISKKGLKYLAKQRNMLKFSQKRLGKILGIHQASISSLELGKFNPSDDYLKEYCKVINLSFEKFVQEYAAKTDSIKLPAILTPKLAQFIGYLVGDGNIEKERIALNEGNIKIATAYKKMAKKLFNANTSITFRKNKNYYQVRIYGKPIVNYLTKELPELCDKTISSKVLKSESRTLAAFIKGLFDAEGYVGQRGLSIGMNNKKIIKQLQLALLRFGILSSIYEYDNKANPYSKKIRYTLDITEKYSLEEFDRLMGFSLYEKQLKLKKCIKNKIGKSNVRQIIIPGTKIKKMLWENEFNSSNFPKVSDFFRNKKMMSKNTFRKSIIKLVKDKKLKGLLEKIAKIPLLPVKIAKLQHIKGVAETIDISTSAHNFIANGLIVHNSAHRFEHLREEAEHNFYVKISEIVNATFLPHQDKLKGIVIGGPGITKNYFLNTELIDHRLRAKIIGKVDTSYTDEYGIKEMIEKASDILKETDIIKEKGKIQRFLGEIARGGAVAYGEKEVLEALAIGKAKELLVSEDLGREVYKFKCNSCGKEEEFVSDGKINVHDKKCTQCNSNSELLEEDIDFIDYLIEKASMSGATVSVISTDTDEGKQFLQGFGGMGAFLRYK